MKSTYLGRSCRSLPAPQLELDAANAVLEAPLPRDSRNIDDLENGRSFYLGPSMVNAPHNRAH